MWNGTRGVLTANDRKKASHRIFCPPRLKSDSDTTAKSVLPTL